MPLLTIGDDALWRQHDNAWLPVPTPGARLRLRVSSGEDAPVFLDLIGNTQNWRVSSESAPAWKALLARILPRPLEAPARRKGNCASIDASIVESPQLETLPVPTSVRNRPGSSRREPSSSSANAWPAPAERPWRGVTTRPDLVIHADWNTSGRRQWYARAELGADGVYRVGAAASVDMVPDFISYLLRNAQTGATVLAGFDFGIGVPLAYAERIGCSDFKDLLLQLGGERFPHFFAKAATWEEISLDRPFYPARAGPKGSTLQTHLVNGLGLGAWSELLRECDRKTALRPAASALFWCLGAKQVGSAVISGWRELLQPALHAGREHVRLWPFDGELDALLSPGNLVIAETYPRELYGHLGIAPVKKRDPSSRRDAAGKLEARARELGVLFSNECRAQINDGFASPGMGGDDGFDAVVGLVGMLNVLLGRRSPGDPSSQARRAVEGWMLGR